jgi:hypothetical protein
VNLAAYRAILRRLGVEPEPGSQTAEGQYGEGPPRLGVNASGTADGAAPRASYAFPWPDGVPGIGARSLGAFASCERCGSGSWVRYGTVTLCLRCAEAAEGSGRPRAGALSANAAGEPGRVSR